jgi:DNA-binding NarL/FixJ family response regulator
VTAPIRVVLAEDNALLRDGVSRLLASQGDLELVGAAADLPSLLALVAEAEPDVVLTDIRMPPTGTNEGIRAADELRVLAPGAGVVVLSQYAEPDYALALLAKGSAGRAYLLKERVGSVDELLGAIREVAAGGSVIDPKVVESLVTATTKQKASELDRLTPREREILAEMAQGKNNAAIASVLVLSERAVEKHTNSIFAKLGLTEEPDVNRRVKAVLVWLAEEG